MKMRMPMIPLITVDPYFSVWSKDQINKTGTVHWTNKPNTILGVVNIDGESYRFLGDGDGEVINQISIDADVFTTTAVYENEKIRLIAEFTSPMLINDLYLASRPVSYLKLSYNSVDKNEHKVSVEIWVSEELCLNNAGESAITTEEVKISNATSIKMGNSVQNVLSEKGDDIRISWGYFYLSLKGQGKAYFEKADNLNGIAIKADIENESLFAFAYDDTDSLIYFEKPVKAYWKKGGKTIEAVIEEALLDYGATKKSCDEFSANLIKQATENGSEEYAELVTLAYRQVMAGHKLCVDDDENNIYISKECFSNGCAATVDVTYPSSPMYLLYNTELLKGMLRPIFKYARSDAWEFDFAPHDAGTYPILNGQTYGYAEKWGYNKLEYQMPVEECGNILIMVSAISLIDGNTDFAKENIDLLDNWCDYLLRYGYDPGNQLCTDDFAGHLSHNCNLSIKAIMGIAGYSKILTMLGETEKAENYIKKAKELAGSFEKRAKNSDGSYRLAYDQPDTFSLKYNAVWDKIWKTELFSPEFFKNEIKKYKEKALEYGVPLDNRASYTKSDWMMWAACLADKKEDFAELVNLLWKAYNETETRAPMTDWYYTDTAKKEAFQHRTVLGGLFIKLLF